MKTLISISLGDPLPNEQERSHRLTAVSRGKPSENQNGSDARVSEPFCVGRFCHRDSLPDLQGKHSSQLEPMNKMDVQWTGMRFAPVQDIGKIQQYGWLP